MRVWESEAALGVSVLIESLGRVESYSARKESWHFWAGCMSGSQCTGQAASHLLMQPCPHPPRMQACHHAHVIDGEMGILGC